MTISTDTKCPNCECDWEYGWYSRVVLVIFLRKHKFIKCSKCKNEFSFKEIEVML